MQQVTNTERTLGELIGELADETRTLVRQEVKLATTELGEKASLARKEGMFVGAGGALIYIGMFAIVAAVILGLAELMPLWLSSLIVGLVVIGGGYACTRKGISGLKQIDPVPRKTVQSFAQDRALLSEKMT